MKNRNYKYILYLVCLFVFILSAVNLFQINQLTRKTNALYDELSKQADSTTEPVAEKTELGQVKEEENTEEKKTEDKMVNAWIKKLQKENADLVAWITIPGTNIDYPVMQTKEDNDYYLDHDFDKNQNAHGTPFLDVHCKVGESQNLIIYGHHMKDETMFQNLMLYKDADFCKENNIIEWKTLEESAKYKISYVLLITVEEAQDFPYDRCINLSHEEIYNAFLKRCEEYAIWSSKKKPKYMQELITLSTCEYSKGNGRLVVIGRKIEE